MNLTKQNSATTTTRLNGLRQWFPISLILLLAANLYFYQLGRESFWIDEIYSIRDVKTGQGLPPNNLGRPLYYIFLSVWIHFGTSDAWLRSLAVIFALGSVFMTYLIGSRLVGKPEGLLAALLLTLSPLFINHAQEVRMYSLCAFLGLAGTLVITYTIERPTNFWIGSWACLRFLAIMTVPLNVTLLIPDLVLVGLKFRKQTSVLFAFGKWLLLICILWTPCVLLKLVPSTVEFSTIPTQVVRPAPSLVDFVRILRIFTAWPFRIEPNTAFAWLCKVFVLILIALVGMALIRKHRSGKLFWVAAWGLMPLAQIFLASNIFFSIWLDRYLLFTSPYLLIILAAGFMLVWRQGRILAFMAALVYLLTVGNGLVHYYTVQKHTDFRGMVQTIKTNEKSGDVVVWAIESWISTEPLVHYDHGSAEIIVEPRVPSTKKSDKQDIENWITKLPPIESRLWLVCHLNERNTQEFIDLLQETFNIQKHDKFTDGKGVYPYHVFLVTPRSVAVKVD
ncbi:MAG: hypothetical protein F6K58_16940 [Symploca sp. SIO2E9]|nr:hypothetical protein [Symploca sp. SIO2E9]